MIFQGNFQYLNLLFYLYLIECFYSSVDVSGNYLRFNYITPADEGRYYCTASNPYGNVTKVAEVVVSRNEMGGNESPSNGSPTYGSTKEVYEGDDVSLTCSAENPDNQFVRVNYKYFIYFVLRNFNFNFY